ncbi:LodA/GoxA family CTQ-dependent oxidase [Streptomyces sp. NPDC056987]|uniref:LodA/GoxA family CTQ-dependent oxidase n=1 Tax=Streptomyces sp. NPDC056987 TaxID=3345988 RepID=UPI0036454874
MDQNITQVKIRPAIGIARVGNSATEFFAGPESPDRMPEQPGFYKDAAGEVVRELKLNEGGVSEIVWTVRLANKKAAWYQFHLPLDIPEGKSLAPALYGRRNAAVVGADRAKLFTPGTGRTVCPFVDDAPVAAQPGLLDRAALEHCAADAFHPGSEVTWPIRRGTLYTEPFRVRHRAVNDPEPDYGASLTAEKALAPNGPTYAQGPGDLTRWMAAPWQTDAARCRSGYEVLSNQAALPHLSAAAGTWAAAGGDAAAVEDALVGQAVRRAVAETRYSEEEISAGYDERLDPFHEGL